jgi:hypothetical protein
MAVADNLYLTYGGMMGFVCDVEGFPIMHQTANLLAGS